jgi:hypothetical protein
MPVLIPDPEPDTDPDKPKSLTIALAEGENPWSVTERVITEQLGRAPTNAEITQIDKMVSAASDISVPEWGISGSVDHQHLPVGYELTFTPDILSAIQALGP